MKTTHVTAKQVPRGKNCALDNNIIAKKIRMKSHLELGNEHEHKLKPVIKQFDVRILRMNTSEPAHVQTCVHANSPMLCELTCVGKFKFKFKFIILHCLQKEAT